MIGQCLVCQDRVELVYSQDRGVYVCDMHLNAASDAHCRGSEYPPMDGTPQARRSTTLPRWVSETISVIAYDRGHSAGLMEVIMIEEQMISEFEEAQKKAEQLAENGIAISENVKVKRETDTHYEVFDPKTRETVKIKKTPKRM